MKRFSLLLTLPALLAAGMALPVYSQTAPQTITQTPFSTPLEVSGHIGGLQNSTCGYVAATPIQQVTITEPFASLNIEVRSTGDYTLLIKGPAGFNECVLAHDFDGGIIQSPGVLTQGTYEIYVGDRSGARQPSENPAFTLVIGP